MKNEKNLEEDSKITEEMKEVVLARIEAQVPSNMKLFVGSSQGMGKEEIIKHIKDGDEIGKKIVLSHMKFIRAVAKGEVIRALNSV